MKKILFSLLTLAVFFSTFVYCEDIFDLGIEEEQNQIFLIVGEIEVIKVSSPQRVSVRNPEVVGVGKVDTNELIITAKAKGETVLTVWDKDGEKSFNITVYSQDLDRILVQLKDLVNKQLKIPQVYFKKNEATGKIIILGEVMPSENVKLKKVLRPFYPENDDEQENSRYIDNLVTVKREGRMVEIDCQILELTKSDLDRLGIDWSDSFTVYEGSVTDPESTDNVKVGTSWKNLWHTREWSKSGLSATINMLLRRGSARELSRPKLTCLSGEEAKLVVGGEVPYVSASETTASGGTGVEIEYRDYGVILTLRPEVLDDSKIVLNVVSEVSELDFANGITVSGIVIPAFTKREAQTVVNITSGETIFVGGLIKNEESKNVDKVPGLAGLPILGALFRSKQFQDDETELVITLTPLLKESKQRVQLDVPSLVQEPKEPVGFKVYPEHLQKEAVLSDYILQIQSQIFRSLDYPRLAEEAGWQGTVKIKMYIDDNGNVRDVKIAESSGYASFDESVLSVARSLSPYPPFPLGVDAKGLWIDIPIVYKLDN